MSYDPARKVIGIDGGGSGARLALDDGTTRVVVEVGPANVTHNFQSAMEQIRHGLNDLANAADLPREAFDLIPAHAGLAGAVTVDICGDVVTDLPLSDLFVTSDVETTLWGHLHQKDGFLISVGTGSFVARKRDGVINHLGGWGLALGDEGSAAWVGRASLQVTTRVFDCLLPVSPLTTKVMKQTGASRAALIDFATTAAPADFAELAVLVRDADAAGDLHAAAILDSGAEYFVRALELLGPRKQDTILLAGGFGDAYRDRIEARIGRDVDDAKGSSLDGALLLARQRLKA